MSLARILIVLAATFAASAALAAPVMRVEALSPTAIHVESRVEDGPGNPLYYRCAAARSRGQ